MHHFYYLPRFLADLISSNMVMQNFFYAFLGVVFGLLVFRWGFWMLNRITPFSISKELMKGNLAVGVMVAGMFVGLGQVVGPIVGMGLN